MTNKILLEICCGSLDDALEAEAGGADRVELNSSMFFGGLTPSIGTIIEAKKRLKIPVCVMVRPRGGGFCYTEGEMAVMEHDTDMAIEQGADGIVFGILNEDGTIDEKRCERIMNIVNGRVEVIFHRAIDVTPDPIHALDQLINLGVKRVLTKGQKNIIYEGIPVIKEMISHAGGRIEILPGGGKPHNILYIVENTGCSQIHMASYTKVRDNSTAKRPDVYFGSALWPSENTYDITDRSVVNAMRDRIEGLD